MRGFGLLGHDVMAGISVILSVTGRNSLQNHRGCLSSLIDARMPASCPFHQESKQMFSATSTEPLPAGRGTG